MPQTEIEKLICGYSWDCNTALAVAKAESGLRCDAVGDGHLTFESNGQLLGASYGVFQIRHLAGRPNPDKLTQCEFNIKYAYDMWAKQGFRPWSAYNSGAYKKFLQ